MFYDITAMVQSLADFGKKIAELKKQKTIQQSETEIIKDRRGLQEATDIAEEINCLARDYIACDSNFTKWLCERTYDFLSAKDKKLCKKYLLSKKKMEKKLKKLQREFEKVN